MLIYFCKNLKVKLNRYSLDYLHYFLFFHRFKFSICAETKLIFIHIKTFFLHKIFNIKQPKDFIMRNVQSTHK